ncbi:MAG: hypothetical protein AAB758_01620 [Patescibacteria group bacterium]
MKNSKEIFENFKLGKGPESDWRIIFVSIIIFAILVSALNIKLFVKINRGEIFATGENSPDKVANLNVPKLINTLDYYQNKKAEFEKIKSGGGAPVVDPSL